MLQTLWIQKFTIMLCSQGMYLWLHPAIDSTLPHTHRTFPAHSPGEGINKYVLLFHVIRLLPVIARNRLNLTQI